MIVCITSSSMIRCSRFYDALKIRHISNQVKNKSGKSVFHTQIPCQTFLHSSLHTLIKMSLFFFSWSIICWNKPHCEPDDLMRIISSRVLSYYIQRLATISLVHRVVLSPSRMYYIEQKIISLLDHLVAGLCFGFNHKELYSYRPWIIKGNCSDSWYDKNPCMNLRYVQKYILVHIMFYLNLYNL